MKIKVKAKSRQKRQLPDAMDSRLCNAHWFWVTALVLLTQLQLFYFLPVAVAVFGITITVMRALSLYFVARSAPNAPGGRRAEQLMDEVQARYGKKKPPFRWSVWLSLILAFIAFIVIFQSYGHLFYRDASVGLLFVLIAIKYAESVTRRDAMLLVCLASFLLITTFFYTQSPLTLISSLLLFFALGGTLNALFHPEATLKTAHVQKTLKRFGVLVLQGIPIAAALFFLFPRLSAPLWGIPHGTLAQTGLSESMDPGEIAELTLSDAIAFRVEFGDAAPPPNRLRYWRGPVFSIFDGISWRLGPTYIAENADFFTEQEEKSAIAYTVTLEPHDRTWLFALEFPYSLPERESAGFERRQRRFAYKNYAQQLLAVMPVTQTIRYRQKSILRNHFPATPQESNFNLRLPLNKNPQTYALAKTLRTAGMSDHDYVDAVLAYFHREPFHYSLSFDNLEMDPQNPVDGFLFGTKTGFCEHYSSAFVVLMRAGGVPARVVTGYQGGEINPQGDYLIVRQSDAHAWAEVLIDGEWQRVDPTAAVAPERVELGLGAALSSGEPVPRLARTDMNWLKNLALHWDALKYSWTRYVIEFDYQRQRSLWSRMNLDSRFWRIALLVTGIIAFWIALLLMVLSWRAKRRDPVQAAWEKLCRKLARADFSKMPFEGAQTFLARAMRRWPQHQQGLMRIDHAYTLLRYGLPDDQERQALLHLLRRQINMFPSAKQLRSETL